jgi:hypothetical protein
MVELQSTNVLVSEEAGVMLRITSQTFLRADLENLLNALAKAHARTNSRDAVTDAAYGHGFGDALEAVATALNIRIEIPSVNGRRRS